eukprot:EG_transcript_18140
MLVDEMGHLLHRRRKEDGDPMNHSFQNNPPPVGKVGYDFSPMTYISHEVRPNMNFVGVRPGLKETNKTAFHYLRRTAANPSSATLTLPRLEGTTATVTGNTVGSGRATTPAARPRTPAARPGTAAAAAL